MSQARNDVKARALSRANGCLNLYRLRMSRLGFTGMDVASDRVKYLAILYGSARHNFLYTDILCWLLTTTVTESQGASTVIKLLERGQLYQNYKRQHNFRQPFTIHYTLSIESTFKPIGNA